MTTNINVCVNCCSSKHTFLTCTEECIHCGQTLAAPHMCAYLDRSFYVSPSEPGEYNGLKNMMEKVDVMRQLCAEREERIENLERIADLIDQGILPSGRPPKEWKEADQMMITSFESSKLKKQVPGQNRSSAEEVGSVKKGDAAADKKRTPFAGGSDCRSSSAFRDC